MYLTIKKTNGSMVKKGTYLVEDIYGKPFISYRNAYGETVHYYVLDLISYSVGFEYHNGE